MGERDRLNEELKVIHLENENLMEEVNELKRLKSRQ